MEAKKWYLSKTLWTNVVMGVLVFVVPQVKEHATPEILGSVFSIVNIVLRFVTTSKLQIT